MLNCLLQNYSSSVLSRWSQHSSRTELTGELNCLMRKYFNVENFLFTFHNCNCSSALEYFPTTLVQHRFIGNFSSFPTFNLFHSDLDNLFQNHLSIKEVKWYLICFKRTMALVAWWSDIKTVSRCCIVICWSNDPHLCGRGRAGLVTIQLLSQSRR